MQIAGMDTGWWDGKELKVVQTKMLGILNGKKRLRYRNTNVGTADNLSRMRG